MKISVITPTYNRAKDLEKLYTSLIVNSNTPGIKMEWLVMDDGSTDKTKIIVENFKEQKIIDIKYFYQANRGKMAAVNNLMDSVTGDIVFTCDSDDYLTTDALEKIKKYSKYLLEDETVYALVFLKQNEKGEISGEKFQENLHRSDMFSLYFRENMTGEKIIVFKTSIRKKFKHELEADEKFITESRMYHKIDEKYDILGINEVIEIGDYKEDGYSKNIMEMFKKYPLGYYMYFKELLAKDLKDVPFSKKMYIYKQYILFANLAQQGNSISNVHGLLNKIIIAILWIPGTIMTKKRFKIDDDTENENKKESKSEIENDDNIEEEKNK